ncbi:MAG: bifunctional proline dehydrogenase/L-glutamate gamma-semialdehyde dehydrogenase PutA [Gammaproteobacteria bacterium]|nr:bifunctional proline dehydrogenase/L-glutamate gamma-semialdehyde dehydrogenase PutA [Gammaproteobacteria bacterium]
MLQAYKLNPPEGQKAIQNQAYRAPELEVIAKLLDYTQLSDLDNAAIEQRALALVEEVRILRKKAVGVDSLLNTFSLSTQEGIALMCLAEALLRVPDQTTIDKLIRDKLTSANWAAHTGDSDSMFINATTWALVLTGKVLKKSEGDGALMSALKGFINRSGEPVVRTAVNQAMKVLSKQFVMGRTIAEAIKRSAKTEEIGYLHSYDMLGEAALTEADAERYFEAYRHAIITLGEASTKDKGVEYKSNISVKLSALHPRYQEAFADRVRPELGARLLALAELAKAYQVSLIVDAEESERLELSLDIIEDVYLSSSLEGWTGLGIAVQSYQKRAFDVLDWIVSLFEKGKRRIMVRLIKGAYWDSEIKKSQMQGLEDYPVFTRKVFTDVSFQACAKKMFAHTDAIFPSFATHNARSVATIIQLAGTYRDFEFQALHGMGKELYEQIVPQDKLAIPCRVYAPVGSHEDLLPYLVRRLLENGANSSFVNRIIDDSLSLTDLVEDPVLAAKKLLGTINKNIPLPWAIFMPERINSKGIDWSNRQTLATLQTELEPFQEKQWQASPRMASDETCIRELSKIMSPQDTRHQVGEAYYATEADVESAFVAAKEAFKIWSFTDVLHRAAILEKFADLLEVHTVELLALATREAGKTMGDGIAEIREAVDFCRYYAVQAREVMPARVLKGYTGELNELSLHPRGVVVCISPWNFPLAIFVGQIMASLAAGNVVLAKPAEQTSLMACRAHELMLEAGFPKDVIQILPGRGETIGAAMVSHPDVAAVIFTGSTQVAQIIQKSLAQKTGPITPLIAETGGLNAMIVDSSALLEQVVNDAVISAFGSAGQRCSALRVLFIQKDVYPRFKHLLEGAMAELTVGLPQYLSTDVGPVIDDEAAHHLKIHVQKMKDNYPLIAECQLSEACLHGHFIAPMAIEIPALDVLEKEEFGPILHVVTFEADGLENVVEQINQSGYGLTLGVQSRIQETVDYVRKHAHVGNCYVNRNMIGAVVGLQAFGGEGLSGTGPKAGGPMYLPRLCHERCFTVDTTAAGGNASLMSLSDE